MKKLVLPFFMLIIVYPSTAQDDDTVRWASPNVKYMPVGRGLDFSYTHIFSSTIESEAKVERLADNSAEVKSLEQMHHDLKFPIVINDRTQFLGSVEYTFDYFEFKNSDNIDYELYKRMDHRHLRSRKLKFYVVHGFDDRHYMNTRLAIALNGDVSDSDESIFEFAKYSFSFTYGWQKSAMNSYGIGIYADYTLGKPSVYPVIEWNKSWNERWGFESKIPAQFLIRYMPYEGIRFYGGYDVDGISYRVFAEDENTTLLKQFEIRRSDVVLMLSMEKRIYDFVWAGVEGGLNYNIRVDASDGDKLYEGINMLESDLDPAPYINLSLFILPTEGLKKLFGYTK